MSDVLTVKKFSEKYPVFTEHTLRHFIFFNTNGFHVCIRRVGRRIYILENEFFKWLDEKNKVHPQQHQ